MLENHDQSSDIQQDSEFNEELVPHGSSFEVLNGGRAERAGRPADAIVDTSKIAFWEETQSVIDRLEASFSTRALLLYVSDGFSLASAEVSEIYQHLHVMGPQQRLVVIVHGSGGNPIAAYRLVRLLRRFAEELIIVAPGDAYSALTMFALGGDRILVGPCTIFSPTDTSIANHPLAPKDSKGNPVTVEIFQLKKYLELVEVEKYSAATDFRTTPHQALSEQIHPIFLGSIQRSLSLSKQVMTDILKTHVTDSSLIARVVDRLNDAYPSHAYPIMAEELSALGLNIEELSQEQNAMALDLMRLAESFGKGTDDSKNEVRTVRRRATVIESKELRSFFSIDREERLNNGQWVVASSKSEYRRAAVVKTKRGYYEARLLSTKEMRTLMTGCSIEVD